MGGSLRHDKEATADVRRIMSEALLGAGSGWCVVNRPQRGRPKDAESNNLRSFIDGAFAGQQVEVKPSSAPGYKGTSLMCVRFLHDEKNWDFSNFESLEHAAAYAQKLLQEIVRKTTLLPVVTFSQIDRQFWGNEPDDILFTRQFLQVWLED